MASATDIETALQDFETAIDGTRWSVRILRCSSATAVCLGLERRVDGSVMPVETIDIRRSFVTRAVESAHRHIFNQRLS